MDRDKRNRKRPSNRRKRHPFKGPMPGKNIPGGYIGEVKVSGKGMQDGKYSVFRAAPSEGEPPVRHGAVVRHHLSGRYKETGSYESTKRLILRPVKKNSELIMSVVPDSRISFMDEVTQFEAIQKNTERIYNREKVETSNAVNSEKLSIEELKKKYSHFRK